MSRPTARTPAAWLAWAQYHARIEELKRRLPGRWAGPAADIWHVDAIARPRVRRCARCWRADLADSCRFDFGARVESARFVDLVYTRAASVVEVEQAIRRAFDAMQTTTEED